MLSYITTEKVALIADLADQVALRPRTVGEDMRRVEDPFADLLDSIESEEFKKFQIFIKSLTRNELIDLVAIVFVGKGECDSYKDARDFLLKNSPTYDYVIFEVLKISFFIVSGISIIKNSHSSAV